MKRDLSTLQANADLHAVLELLKRWRDKSDNEDLKEFEKMMINISLYIWQLQKERKTFDTIIDRLRSDKLRAIQRARRVEKKLEEYEKIQRKNDSISI